MASMMSGTLTCRAGNHSPVSTTWASPAGTPGMRLPETWASPAIRRCAPPTNTGTQWTYPRARHPRNPAGFRPVLGRAQRARPIEVHTAYQKAFGIQTVTSSSPNPRFHHLFRSRRASPGWMPKKQTDMKRARIVRGLPGASRVKRPRTMRWIAICRGSDHGSC